jgi:hypothetical protein
VKDIDSEMKQLTVRDGKGAKDRVTVLSDGELTLNVESFL